MNKFEQLIEFVINDDEDKARELFHEIVVEKSREIYEDLMDETADVSGDSSDQLMREVETEESGIAMEDGEEGYEEEEEEEEGEEEEEEGEEEESGEDLEDRVVDLEDKLDELMAEFEALMGDEAGEEPSDFDDTEVLDIDAGGDALEVDDTQEFSSLEENVALKAAPAPVKSEVSGTNTKSAVAANSGARGALAQPVKATGTEAKGRPAPGTKELIGKVGNTPAQSTQDPSAAPKPVTTQAAGVNTRTPFPKA